MPKPQKDSSILANLRPIGLVHPMGKSVTVVLRTKLLPTLTEALVTRPQFAYARGRSTLDALLRAHGHISQTRQVVEDCKIFDIRPTLRSGAEPLFWGVSASASTLRGLSMRFRGADWQRVCSGSKLIRSLVHLIMHMQHEAQYWNNVGADARPVKPTQGIKQGCCIAPYLFVAYTIMVMDKPRVQMTPDWQDDGLTWYADDAFAAWLVRGADDLRQALSDIHTIISVLRDHGMEIQQDKCAVLLNLHGKEKTKILKHRIVHRNEQAHLVVRTSEEVLIPIKKHHEYLGTVLAYRDPGSALEGRPWRDRKDSTEQPRISRVAASYFHDLLSVSGFRHLQSRLSKADAGELGPIQRQSLESVSFCSRLFDQFESHCCWSEVLGLPGAQTAHCCSAHL